MTIQITSEQIKDFLNNRNSSIFHILSRYGITRESAKAWLENGTIPEGFLTNLASDFNLTVSGNGNTMDVTITLEVK